MLSLRIHIYILPHKIIYGHSCFARVMWWNNYIRASFFWKPVDNNKRILQTAPLFNIRVWLKQSHRDRFNKCFVFCYSLPPQRIWMTYSGLMMVYDFMWIHTVKHNAHWTTYPWVEGGLPLWVISMHPPITYAYNDDDDDGRRANLRHHVAPWARPFTVPNQ